MAAMPDTSSPLPTDMLDTDVGRHVDRRWMPRRATDELKERTRFVLEWERRWSRATGLLGRRCAGSSCRNGMAVAEDREPR
jgi:hypothetical protein